MLPPTPPSTPEPWTEFKHIRVVKKVEYVWASPEADVKLSTDLRNGPSKFGCAPANQIESSNSDWYQVGVEAGPEINVVGKSNDGGYYDVAVHSTYLPWLSSRGLELNLNYNPTPTEKDISVHGTWDATRRAHARFLLDAVNTIRSRRGRELERRYRDIARSNGLAISLERAILNHDILESDPQVRKQFTRCLVFLGLNLLESYDSPFALKLLAKDEDDLLQPFRKGRSLFEAASETEASILEGSGLHNISLLRRLLEFSGGMVECRQHALDRERSISDNVNLFGLLIGIVGTNRFGSFDSKQMHDALSKSGIFAGDSDISTLDTVEWSMQLMKILPIGFPKGYLHLPSQILCRLGPGQVDLVCMHLDQIYHQRSSLRKSENNVLLLLTWSSIAHGQPLQVLSEWASSVDGSKLYQQLVEDLRNSQDVEQLALILAALVCHQRLLPYFSNDTAQPAKGGYLADLNFLLNGQLLSNRRVVFERMGFSFLRVLDTFGNKYKDMVQLLTLSIAKKAPLLERLDGVSDQYWAKRATNGLDHRRVYEEEGALKLIETSAASDMNDSQEWSLITFDHDLEGNGRCGTVEGAGEGDGTGLTMV